MINLSNKEAAYSEVWGFINALDENTKAKIPNKICNKIEFNRLKSYNPLYNLNQEVNEKTFSREALAIITAIYLQYLCDDEDEKNNLRKFIRKNGEIENQNLFNIFDNRVGVENKVSIVNYEKIGLFSKIQNWFKKIFCKEKK